VRTPKGTVFAEVLKHQPSTELLSLAAMCLAELERRAKRQPRDTTEAAA
jgi:hypothetical protein